jgi:LPXTG-motif cell wall-anchored protein
MKTINRLRYFILAFAFSFSIANAQLDPLPGDPLPGDPDPGIEVPLDAGILIGLFAVVSGVTFFVVKKKKK